MFQGYVGQGEGGAKHTRSVCVGGVHRMVLTNNLVRYVAVRLAYRT